MVLLRDAEIRRIKPCNPIALHTAVWPGSHNLFLKYDFLRGTIVHWPVRLTCIKRGRFVHLQDAFVLNCSDLLGLCGHLYAFILAGDRPELWLDLCCRYLYHIVNDFLVIWCLLHWWIALWLWVVLIVFSYSACLFFGLKLIRRQSMKLSLFGRRKCGRRIWWVFAPCYAGTAEYLSTFDMFDSWLLFVRIAAVRFRAVTRLHKGWRLLLLLDLLLD